MNVFLGTNLTFSNALLKKSELIPKSLLSNHSIKMLPIFVTLSELKWYR